MLNNEVVDKFYKTRKSEMRDLLSVNPQLATPVVTQQDAKQGYIMRYFVRPVNDSTNITEIDKNQYEILKSNARFITAEVKWKIVGKQETRPFDSRVNIYGIGDMNRMEVANVDANFGGLKNYISNYLEFWFSE